MKYTKSKIIKQAYQNYISQTTKKDLYDFFKQPSDNKRQIYWHWQYTILPKMHGYDLAVLGGNCQDFTLGFLYPDKDTGEIMFAYITKYNQRTCSIADLI